MAPVSGIKAFDVKWNDKRYVLRDSRGTQPAEIDGATRDAVIDQPAAREKPTDGGGNGPSCGLGAYGENALDISCVRR